MTCELLRHRAYLGVLELVAATINQAATGFIHKCKSYKSRSSRKY